MDITRAICRLRFLMVVAGALWPLSTLAAGSVAPYTADWIQQFGTADWDQAHGVSADGTGNIYVAGETTGSLGGTNAGQYDAFISSFNVQGGAQGSTQFGTPGTDIGTGVAADGTGNVFVSGYSQGSVGGSYQAILNNYTPSGILHWSKSIGPPQTYAYGVAANGRGSAYVTGYTTASLNEPNAGGYDGFVAKYDEYGNAVWTHQFGTSSQDQAYGVATDGANGIYVAGSTLGSLGGANAGGYDAFLRKYDAAGNVQWMTQLGTSGDDIAQAVAANKLGSVFVVGNTTGSLGGTNAGLADAFVSKYNSAGILQWSKQLGTAANDYATGAAADAHGNVFVVGYTQGSLAAPNAGGSDAFLSEFNSFGQQLWTEQFGTPGNDLATSISLDGFGHVFVAGSTTGSLSGTNAGSYDAWVARFSPVLMPGDFNRDGVVDTADIPAMLTALADLNAYEAKYDLSPSELQIIGDINGDKAVTNADFQALLNTIILEGQTVQNVPEPASLWMLACGGLLCLMFTRQFRTVVAF
jgi:hypothetical protein